MGFHPQRITDLRDEIRLNEGSPLLAKVVPLVPQHDTRAFQGGTVVPQVLYRVWVRCGVQVNQDTVVTWSGRTYHLVTPPLLLSKNRWTYFLMEEDLA